MSSGYWELSQHDLKWFGREANDLLRLVPKVRKTAADPFPVSGVACNVNRPVRDVLIVLVPKRREGMRSVSFPYSLFCV